MMEVGNQAAAFQPEVLFERGFFEMDLAESWRKETAARAELMIIFRPGFKGFFGHCCRNSGESDYS